jgi:hypothetical protein
VPTPGIDDVETQPLDSRELRKLLDTERGFTEQRRTAEHESVNLNKLRADCRNDGVISGELSDDSTAGGASDDLAVDIDIPLDDLQSS